MRSRECPRVSHRSVRRHAGSTSRNAVSLLRSMRVAGIADGNSLPHASGPLYDATAHTPAPRGPTAHGAGVVRLAKRRRPCALTISQSNAATPSSPSNTGGGTGRHIPYRGDRSRACYRLPTAPLPRAPPRARATVSPAPEAACIVLSGPAYALLRAHRRPQTSDKFTSARCLSSPTNQHTVGNHQRAGRMLALCQQWGLITRL